MFASRFWWSGFFFPRPRSLETIIYRLYSTDFNRVKRSFRAFSFRRPRCKPVLQDTAVMRWRSPPELCSRPSFLTSFFSQDDDEFAFRKMGWMMDGWMCTHEHALTLWGNAPRDQALLDRIEVSGA